MELALQDRHGLLQTPMSKYSFGVLSNNAFRGLSNCASCETFKVEALVLSEDWKVKVEEVRKLQTNRRKIVRIDVDLLLFGPREFGDRLAADIGACQMFLQVPHDGATDVLYSNPQSLSLADRDYGEDLLDSEMPPSLLSQQFYGGEGELEDQPTGSGQLADLITNIDAFFDQVPGYHSISVAAKDNRILNSLFR